MNAHTENFSILFLPTSLLFCMKVKVMLLSRVRLFTTPSTVAYQAPQSMEFSRQEYKSGLSFPSPGDLPYPGIEPRSLALQADTLPSEPPGKAVVDISLSMRIITSSCISVAANGIGMKVLVTQSCPTLCNPRDCNLSGSLVHGILQARILEWVAIRFSKGSSRPRDQAWVSCTAGRFFTVWATQ